MGLSDSIPLGYPLPLGWRECTLSEVCTKITDGTHKTPNYQASGIRFISIKNIRPYQPVDWSAYERFISAEDHAELAKRCDPEFNDVLFPRIGTLGFAKRIDFHQKVSLFVGLGLLRPDCDALSSQYLEHWMNTPFIARLSQERATGSGRLTLALREARRFPIPLPPLVEQKRIAAILDAANDLRAKRCESLAQCDALLRSTFLDMFGDGKRNPNRWPVAQIGGLIADVRGGASLKPGDFTTTGFPVLHKGAIKPRGVVALDSGKKTFAKAEHVETMRRSVVTREFTVVTLRDLVPSGPSIGLAAHLGRSLYPEYLLAQGAYGFRLDQARIVPDYFVALSNDVGFRTVLKRYSVGSTQIHIRNPVYQKIEIPVPPIDLQHHFATIVEAIEKQKELVRAHLAELDTLFASLQQRAFNGELSA